MKIATILPTPYLGLEEGNDYHLCLAHLVQKDGAYAAFFRSQSEAGRFVMMDNGVVETGEALPMPILMDLTARVKAKEIVLPDEIYNRERTIRACSRAISEFLTFQRAYGAKVDLAAVPQGADAREWINCVRTMVDWPVKTIGISRFVAKYFPSRKVALESVPELIESKKDIHILGCPGDPIEMCEIEEAFPGRVRGVDSGIAAMYTQEEMQMEDGDPKPQVELDFGADNFCLDLLEQNVEWWRKRCKGEV